MNCQSESAWTIKTLSGAVVQGFKVKGLIGCGSYGMVY